MAVTAFHGRLGSVYNTTGSTSAAQDEIGQINGWKVSVTRPKIPVTNNDSSGWAEAISGIADWEATVGVTFGTTAAANETIRNGIINATTLQWIFRPTTETTGGMWRGPGQVTGFDINGETAGAFDLSLSVSGTAGLTWTTSTS